MVECGGWRNRFGAGSVRTLMAGVALAIISGCAGSDPGQKPTGNVAGVVTFEGKPVTGGTLIFSPMPEGKDNTPGKSGQATIKSDGTFVATTYSDGDGAVIGQHRILFTAAVEAPTTDPAGGHAEPKLSPYAGLVPKKAQLDIFRGENKLEIELIKEAPAAAAPSAATGS